MITRSRTAGGDPNGFTFVEIMVVIVVIAVGLFPILGLFTSTTSDISSTVEDVMLLNYANEIIDSILAFPYDEIPGYLSEEDISNSKNAFAVKLSSQISKAPGEYRRELKITGVNLKVRQVETGEMDFYSMENFKKNMKVKMVTAAVSYNPPGGKKREMKTLVLVSKE
ncbi:MAG TPA: prepilin-type N-terminal cleavage/methylation domain-containing protein [Candidatus Wallbacteria bacterium]|nr:prepilin-type N-terminal cleavage/methylation domain-containing protein [Candidatus Wallbacteria bacterium]